MRTAAAEVERDLFSTNEWQDVQAALEGAGLPHHDQFVHLLLETVRTGAVIADYAITSARRRRDTPPVLHFGYLMYAL